MTTFIGPVIGSPSDPELRKAAREYTTGLQNAVREFHYGQGLAADGFSPDRAAVLAKIAVQYERGEIKPPKLGGWRALLNTASPSVAIREMGAIATGLAGRATGSKGLLDMAEGLRADAEVMKPFPYHEPTGTIGEAVGGIAGSVVNPAYAVPFGAAAKVISPATRAVGAVAERVGGRVAGEVAQHAATGAALVGGYSGAAGLAETGSLKEAVKAFAQGAAVGGALGGGIAGAVAGVRGVGQALRARPGEADVVPLAPVPPESRAAVASMRPSALRFSAETLTAPEGARQLAESNPALARAIASKSTPSRADVAPALAPGQQLSTRQRTALADRIRVLSSRAPAGATAPSPPPQVPFVQPTRFKTSDLASTGGLARLAAERPVEATRIAKGESGAWDDVLLPRQKLSSRQRDRLGARLKALMVRRGQVAPTAATKPPEPAAAPKAPEVAPKPVEPPAKPATVVEPKVQVAAPVEQVEPLVRQVEPTTPARPGVTFRTGRAGSVYTVKGTTTQRAEGKTEGIEARETSGKEHEASERTVYVNEATARALEIIYAEGFPKDKRPQVTIESDGTVRVVRWSGRPNYANRIEKTYPSEAAPHVGLQPFEMLPGGRSHLGSEITEISGAAPAAPPAPPPQPAKPKPKAPTPVAPPKEPARAEPAEGAAEPVAPVKPPLFRDVKAAEREYANAVAQYGDKGQNYAVTNALSKWQTLKKAYEDAKAARAQRSQKPLGKAGVQKMAADLAAEIARKPEIAKAGAGTGAPKLEIRRLDYSVNPWRIGYVDKDGRFVQLEMASFDRKRDAVPFRDELQQFDWGAPNESWTAAQREAASSILSKTPGAQIHQRALKSLGEGGAPGARRGLIDLGPIEDAIRGGLKAAKWTAEHTLEAARWLWHQGVNTMAAARSALKAAFGPGIGPRIARILRRFKNYLTEEFAGITPRSVFMSRTPTTQGLIDKFVAAIKAAKPLRGSYELEKHLELQRRASKVGEALETPGKAGIRAGFQELKGELVPEGPPRFYESIAGKFSDAETTALIEHAKGHMAEHKVYDQLRVGKVILSVLENGYVPTEGELATLDRVFGPAIVRALAKKTSRGSRARAMALEILSMPKSLKSTFDLSATLRQGWFLTTTHPLEAGRAAIMEVRAFASESYTRQVEETLAERPWAETGRAAGLQMPRITGEEKLSVREEAFQSHLLQRWGPTRVITRPSERAFNTYLNVMRARTFDAWAEKLKNAGVDPRENIAPYKELAQAINAMTGRTNLHMGDLAPILNAVFFSPKLLASRFELPIQAMRLMAHNPQGANRALQQFGARVLAAQAGTLLGTLGLIALANEAFGWNAEIVVNPWDPRFGRIAFGKTTIETGGGIGQVVRFLTQLTTRQAFNPQTGRMVTRDRWQNVKLYLRTKLAPVPATTVDLVSGTRYGGRPIRWVPDFEKADLGLPAELVAPISLTNALQVWREHGAAGTLLMPAEQLGMGVSVYDPETTRGRGTRPTRPTRPMRPKRPGG